MQKPRLIVDNNQMNALLGSTVPISVIAQQYDIILIYPVLCEFLDGFDLRQSKELLALVGNVRIGKEPSHFHEMFVSPSKGRMRNYNALHEIGSNVHKFVMGLLSEPAKANLEATRKKRMQDKVNAEKLQALITEKRKQSNDGKKIENFDNVKKFTLHFVQRNFQTRSAISHNKIESLIAVLFQNPFLRHYYLSLTAFHVAFAQGYQHNLRALNRPIAPKRNDYPDMQLAGYAKEGDTILTTDRHLREIISFIGEGKILTATWSEFTAQSHF